jgi:hypothetical protein
MDEQRAAAARLRHDLARYIRFWAPETLEADTEALRQRLTRDVLETRSGPGGVLAATAIFDAWLAEEAGAFEGVETLGRLRASMDELGALARRLPELGRAELERLDRLTRDVAEDCRRLAREASR